MLILGSNPKLDEKLLINFGAGTSHHRQDAYKKKNYEQQFFSFMGHIVNNSIFVLFGRLLKIILDPSCFPDILSPISIYRYINYGSNPIRTL